ncbi:MAG: hypothetical protein QOJ46_490 [bacterium]
MTAPATPRRRRAEVIAPDARRALRAEVIAPDARRRLRAVVIGPGARRALRDGASGTVELAFGPGGYVCLSAQRVLLAPARSPLGPLSVLVPGLARGDLVPGDAARVAGDTLVAGPLRIDLLRARAAPPPLPRTSSLAPGWRAALAAALDVVAPAPAELAPGLDALAAGDLAAGAAALAGRGDGLTPAGDDALAGFAAWRWARGGAVSLPARRCAPLGRDYLRCAERGELPQPAAAVLQAILAGDAGAAARRACGLAGWGASSGAALLWGLAAGAAQTRKTPPRSRAPGSR